jgi:G3E family GTPase
MTTGNVMAERIGAEKIPVTVLTGFLGSGKTTVLNALVKNPALPGTAVIINEFGEIGLDHELVQHSDEQLMLVRDGCICCTVRGDLVSTLGDLSARRQTGQVPPFERVLIETTGLADPAPILHTLMNDAAIAGSYGLGAVVTTLDAVNGLGTLDSHQEAVKQAGVADLLLLTKTDLAPPETVSALRERLAALNPGARILTASNGRVDVAHFFAAGLYRPETKNADVQSWLNAEAYGEADSHAHAGAHDHEHAGHGDHNRHSDRIRAFCVVREQPISWTGFSAWLDLVSAMRGDDLLRVKGIVNVLEEPGRPLVIHGVQHIFHPPMRLDAWPSDDHRTRIVFITRDIDRETIEDTLRVFERRRARKPSNL